jgi:hypothetical protein
VKHRRGARDVPESRWWTAHEPHHDMSTNSLASSRLEALWP